ncbi:MAG: hypothetical protein ACYDEX_00065 [Mobilitalea sp.]
MMSQIIRVKPGITIVNGLNAFSSKGVASHKITIDDDYEQSNLESGKTSEERLNELQSHFEKNMISPDEYQAKRKQILDDL